MKIIKERDRQDYKVIIDGKLIDFSLIPRELIDEYIEDVKALSREHYMEENIIERVVRIIEFLIITVNRQTGSDWTMEEFIRQNECEDLIFMAEKIAAAVIDTLEEDDDFFKTRTDTPWKSEGEDDKVLEEDDDEKVECKV